MSLGARGYKRILELEHFGKLSNFFLSVYATTFPQMLSIKLNKPKVIKADLLILIMIFKDICFLWHFGFNDILVLVTFQFKRQFSFIDISDLVTF